MRNKPDVKVKCKSCGNEFMQLSYQGKACPKCRSWNKIEVKVNK